MLRSATIGREKCVVFSWDLKDAAESIEQRLGLSKFQTDGMETKRARDAKLD